MKTNHAYDVIILGSSLSGTMAGAVLARHGLSVLILEKGMHPRFAIGEATTPDISFRFKNLSLKYDVPEFQNLAAFHKLRDHVGPSSGLKRAFSFLYHRDGQDQNPLESHQYPTLAPPMGPDCHFFRQDTDAYLLTVAMRYGADLRQKTWIEDITFEEDQVAIVTTKGDTVTAQYVIDAAGMGSPLAKKFDLRGDPDTFRTNSRGMFTHMIGVKLYDQVAGPRKAYGLKHAMSQGTLHHVFHGGWFWIIPFNNHADAVNPLCSVGLILDRNVYPETGMDPEEEFFHFAGKFPAVARQFEGARAVRGWMASRGRLQYCSKQMTGHRYCLVPSAAAFIDPLFSSGINLTLSGIDMLAKRLFHAFKTGDFSVEPFRDIDTFFRINLVHFDDVISSAFVSFQDFELWDAWYRVWVIGLLMSTALNANLYMQYQETGDRALLSQSEGAPYNRALGLAFSDFRAVYDQALAEIDAVRSGQADPKAAAAAIRLLFKETNHVPHSWNWHDPAVRTTPAFNVWGMTRMYFWYVFKAPRHVRKQLYNWSAWTAYKYVFKAMLAECKRAKRQRTSYVRDVFKAWNRDWTREQESTQPLAAFERRVANPAPRSESVPPTGELILNGHEKVSS